MDQLLKAMEDLNTELRGAVNAETELGKNLDKVIAAVGNIDNRRAKFPTRLNDGENND